MLQLCLFTRLLTDLVLIPCYLQLVYAICLQSIYLHQTREGGWTKLVAWWLLLCQLSISRCSLSMPLSATQRNTQMAPHNGATWRQKLGYVNLLLHFTLSLSVSLLLLDFIQLYRCFYAMYNINVIIATGCFCETDDKDVDDNGPCIGACPSRCPSNAVALGR